MGQLACVLDPLAHSMPTEIFPVEPPQHPPEVRSLEVDFYRLFL